MCRASAALRTCVLAGVQRPLKLCVLSERAIWLPACARQTVFDFRTDGRRMPFICGLGSSHMLAGVQSAAKLPGGFRGW